MSSNSRETEHNEELRLSDDPAMQGRIEAQRNPAEAGDALGEDASPEAKAARGTNADLGDPGPATMGTEGADPVTGNLDRQGHFEGSIDPDRDGRRMPDGEKGGQRQPAVGNYETSGTEAPPKSMLGKDY